MKLTYRGVSYDSTPSPDSTVPVLTVDLKYRGATCRLSQTTKAAALNTILKYRGVAYNPQSEQLVATGLTEAAPESIQDKARFLMMNHHRTVKNRQQVMLSRSAAEVGLTANLTNYWNHIQGKVHPSFWATYDRSHSTLA